MLGVMHYLAPVIAGRPKQERTLLWSGRPGNQAFVAGARDGWVTSAHVRIFLIFLVFVSGLGQPVQVAANSRLRESVHSPVLAGLLSLCASVAILALLTASGLTNRGSLQELGNAPWWVWLGGACAALSIVAGLLALPLTSAAGVIVAAIFGQLLASMLIDHFGWLGVRPVRISLSRIAGAILLIVGALLIQRP